MFEENKEMLFSSMVSSVSRCDLCPRMCNRKKVLSVFNGNINSKVVFIAEAPGRLGAESTGIPLFGDVTGNNFETLLSNIGWDRSDIFITNAILCNPQDESGNNATPTKNEIVNCSYYLDMVIELIRPEVIVTLGTKALDALNMISPHNYTLKENVAKLVPWNGLHLFPMYHLSPRATVHRSTIQQRADFIALSHEVSPLTGLKKIANNPRKTEKTEVAIANKQQKLKEMVEYIVFRLHNVSFFKLTKLLFLSDLKSLRERNTTISNSIYLRMQEGPWIPYLKNIVQDSTIIRSIGKYGKSRLVYCAKEYNSGLSQQDLDIIERVLQATRDCDDGQIKTMVYMTPPMKYILREEKKGRSMLKIPIIYNNKTVEEMDKKAQ